MKINKSLIIDISASVEASQLKNYKYNYIEKLHYGRNFVSVAQTFRREKGKEKGKLVLKIMSLQELRTNDIM